MAELEPQNGMTDLPLPGDVLPARTLPPAEEVIRPQEELPSTPEGWAKRLRELDFKDHRKAIAIVGAGAAAALVVGAVIAVKRRGDSSYFITYADRRAELQRIISVGESKSYGMTVALPVGEEGLQHVDHAADVGSKLLFAMTGEPGEVVRPVGAEQTSGYTDTVKHAASWLIGHFSAQASQTDETK